MNCLINLYNQLGAGPRNISLNLISELRKNCRSGRQFYVVVPDCDEYRALESSPGLMLIKLPRYTSLCMKVAFRFYLDYVKLPQLVRSYGIVWVLAFGNFLVAPVKARKAVLLHHPYLFDDRQLARLPLFGRGVERLKRLAFALTLKNVDNVVVQSQYVLDQFRLKWPGYRGGVLVIENPVSNRLGEVSDEQADALIAHRMASMHECITLVYVSRFYPHKNHEFLLPLSRVLLARGVRHRILVTIDPSFKEAVPLLEQIQASGLPIHNLGEIDQAGLREHYASAHAMLFPSRSETFGNPLVEAIGFGLPVIAPDVGYARAVLANSGSYYNDDDADDCADQILALVRDAGHYQAISRDARARFSHFPRAREWLQRYLSLT